MQGSHGVVKGQRVANLVATHTNKQASRHEPITVLVSQEHVTPVA
jgi:hypothetical protein